MPSKKREFGDRGEELAVNYLRNNGYRILDRNFRIKNIGEIDIIAEKDAKISFFEVKARNKTHETSFPIYTSITTKKRAALKRICGLYLAQNKKLADLEWQVDALFLQYDDSGFFSVEILENILWEKYY